MSSRMRTGSRRNTKMSQSRPRGAGWGEKVPYSLKPREMPTSMPSNRLSKEVIT